MSSPARDRSVTLQDEPPRSASRGRSRTPADAALNGNTHNSRPTARSRSRSPSRARTRSRSRSAAYRARSYSRSPSHSRSRSPSIPRSAKIVIEKLTKNVNANHLREIFATYGPISDLEMPMNKPFLTNRGIAYILYTAPNYAEAAIAHMHEAQLDGAEISSIAESKPTEERQGEESKLLESQSESESVAAAKEGGESAAQRREEEPELRQLQQSESQPEPG
ncbi:hypothetical protein BDY17DRAFT_320140 [Neohortaea acidophila]|uniref:RRM domain-containing protein n=1 Tax=Neohortaea acidophila TaxID=245834 RepID=A0A6A6Q5P4_9PEZI|nr:uncharacterized protein BDY17DRAFT_320140 [Neohortaea acidophila]KAF2487612.1 hypothetical protein BDY17DRAFT_320140 [Neohortaea acidophila]